MLSINIVLSLALLLGTYLFLRGSKYFLKKLGTTKGVSDKRIFYVSKTISMLIVLLSFFLLAIIWSVKLEGILVFASSIFAVIGVALFAQWSVLSNLTSSIIIFFTFPSKIGDNIKIVDGDNSLEGKITELDLFNIKLKDNQDNTIIYPNNLFIQKPIIKINKKDIKTKTANKNI